MSKEVVGLVDGPGSVGSQKDERRDHVLDHKRRGNDRSNTIGEGPLALGEVGTETFLGDTITEGHEGDTQKEHVVSGVESMPEGTHGVDSNKGATSSDVDVSCQPQGRLLVPLPCESLSVGCCFKRNNVHVIGIFKALGVSFFVKAFKAGVPNVVGTFCVFPGKVVLLTNTDETDPSVHVTVDPWVGQEFFRQYDRSVVFWIDGIQEGEVGTDEDKHSHVEK
mmetsp:Transcript_36034/g.53691  ORF Transcript_36034/g.53691 Transcript_36034/m.53691 type:complete len:222 (+) Transcript_36034:243-908(+)